MAWTADEHRAVALQYGDKAIEAAAAERGPGDPLPPVFSALALTHAVLAITAQTTADHYAKGFAAGVGERAHLDAIEDSRHD